VVTRSPRQQDRARQFAAALDGGPVGDSSLTAMLRVATALGTAGDAVSGATPSDQFKSALRQRLLAAAAVAPTSGTGTGAAGPNAWRRRLVAASTVVAITSGGLAGTAVASHSALPGDALYSIKRTVEGVQLVLATSDLSKGERYLAIAEARLTEVEGLLDVAGPRSTDPVMVEQLRKTLGDLRTAVDLARNHFLAAYERTGDASTLQPLEDFIRQMGQELGSLTSLLPAALTADQTSLLASLDAIAQRLAGTTGRVAVGIPIADPIDSAAPTTSSGLPSADAATGTVGGAPGGATGSGGSAGGTAPADPDAALVDLNLGGVAGVPDTSVSIGEDDVDEQAPGVRVDEPDGELLGVVPLPDTTVEADSPVVGDVEVEVEVPEPGN